MRDEILKTHLQISDDMSFHNVLKQNVGKGLLRPQTYWLKNFAGKIELDFIGRFENLQLDFQVVQQNITSPPDRLPHKLKGSGDDYRQYYTNETQQLIFDYYQEEIQLFGYSFFT